MSLRISDGNLTLTGVGATRLVPPSGAFAKPANTACVFGFWFMMPEQGFDSNYAYTLMAKQSAATGAQDGFIKVSQSGNITFYLSETSALIPSQTCGVASPGVPTFAMIMIGPTETWISTCPVGGTPTVTVIASAAPYAAALVTRPLFNGICSSATGGGQNAFYGGSIENIFFLHGSIPAVGGSPDTTLIQNIANGVQSIDTLDALLTGGVKRCWYRLRSTGDFGDNWSVMGDLTVANESATTGRQNLAGRPLRPATLRPVPSFGISQCEFGTPGDASTAFARIPVAAGTYVGIAPAAIQARLRRDDGTALVGWTTVDAAPAGGSWASGWIENVPMTVGYLALDIRAVDGAGAQIGDYVSGGVRGAGFHIIGWAQSQFAQLLDNGGGIALPDGIRYLVTKVSESGASRFYLGSTSSSSRAATLGMRQMAIEINTLFPGVPIQMSSLAQAGRPVQDWISGGPFGGRFAILAAALGPIPPHILLPMGHSSSADTNYRTYFEQVLANAHASLGDPLIYCLVPVPRYKVAGATMTGNALQTAASRNAMREWHEANRSISYWGGGTSIVYSTNEPDAGSDPHPGDTNFGQGRTGAIIAWRAMEAVRAVQSESVGIVSGAFDGNDLVLTIGRISDYPDAA